MTQNSPATSEIQILNALSQTTLIIQLFNTKLSENQMYSGDLNSEHLNSGYLFKPSVTKPISQTTYDLHSELLVRYPSHDLNKEPFDERTILDHSNIELVSYSDPHCIWYLDLAKLENYIAFCQRPPKMFQLNSTSFNARCLQGGESFVAPGGLQLRKLSSTSLYLPSCHSLVLPLQLLYLLK